MNFNVNQSNDKKKIFNKVILRWRWQSKEGGKVKNANKLSLFGGRKIIDRWYRYTDTDR